MYRDRQELKMGYEHVMVGLICCYFYRYTGFTPDVPVCAAKCKCIVQLSCSWKLGP